MPISRIPEGVPTALLSRRGFLQWGGLGSLSLGGLWSAQATRLAQGGETLSGPAPRPAGGR
ncbi:MAG: hypothetical protein ACKO3P_24080, partial [Planctomycetaceae bacterium]